MSIQGPSATDVAPNTTELYREGVDHGSPVGDDRSSSPSRIVDSLHRQEHDPQRVLDMEERRRENSETFVKLMRVTDNPTKRKILSALCIETVVTYDRLEEYTTVSRRTIKTHAHALDDAGIVDVGDGRPAAIRFTNRDVELLASDTLSFTN